MWSCELSRPLEIVRLDFPRPAATEKSASRYGPCAGNLLVDCNRAPLKFRPVCIPVLDGQAIGALG